MERKYPIKKNKLRAPKRFLRAFLQYVQVPSRASIFDHSLKTHNHQRDLQLPLLHSRKISLQHKVLSIGISIFRDGSVAEYHKERLDYLVQNFSKVFSDHVPLSFLTLNPCIVIRIVPQLLKFTKLQLSFFTGGFQVKIDISDGP